MELRLTEQEALALYRIILRWDELGSLTTEDDEERQLLWDLSCTLEKELEPVDEDGTQTALTALTGWLCSDVGAT